MYTSLTVKDMRNFLRPFCLALLVSAIGLSSGCGGPQDGEMEYDAAASQQKTKEYAEQQKAGIEAAMKNRMGGRRPGGKK
jgi:hypothetical protein